MKVCNYLLVLVMAFGFVGVSYAAPVGLISESDAIKSELWPVQDLGLTVGVVSDFLTKRKIDIDSGEFEMTAVMGRFTVSAFDRFSFYADVGQASSMTYKYVIKGENYETEFDNDLIWGVGVNALIYRWENSGLEIGVNGSYRMTDLELDKTKIDNTSYSRVDIPVVSDGDFQEIQGAIELAWRNDIFTPYIGVKYSNVEVDADFTIGGSQRDASGKEASQKIGAFIGLTIIPDMEIFREKKSMAITLEGRFIDESSGTLSITYRF